jgi:hypothetical protein
MLGGGRGSNGHEWREPAIDWRRLVGSGGGGCRRQRRDGQHQKRDPDEGCYGDLRGHPCSGSHALLQQLCCGDLLGSGSMTIRSQLGSRRKQEHERTQQNTG